MMLTFFTHELAHLHHNSAQIRHGLDRYPADDPRSAGQLELLETQLECYRLVIDLMGHAASPADALAECRRRYLMAAQQHQQSGQRSGAEQACRSDRWWVTLGQMQYLAHLTDQLKAWLSRYPEEEICRENHDQNGKSLPAETIQAAVQEMETLRAVASAHERALAGAHRVRDHVDDLE